METIKITSDYEMFTTAGNLACKRLVERIGKKIMGKTRVTSNEIVQMIEDGRKKISVKYGEVYDTEPRYHISRQVSKFLQAAEYGFRLDGYMDVVNL
jgi:hypothetical protein